MALKELKADYRKLLEECRKEQRRLELEKLTVLMDTAHRYDKRMKKLFALDAKYCLRLSAHERYDCEQKGTK